MVNSHFAHPSIHLRSLPIAAIILNKSDYLKKEIGIYKRQTKKRERNVNADIDDDDGLDFFFFLKRDSS